MSGQATWLTLLQARTAAFIGRPVTSVREVERKEGGMRVCGTTLSDAGVPFGFDVCGPFDVEVADPAAPAVPDAQELFPFGTEFGPALPAAGELGDAAALWEWGAPQVPVFAQPRMDGYTGILEKKGGKAKLWFEGNRGVDQLSKFPALKEYVCKLAPDFVAEVSAGVERDGVRLPQAEQEALVKESLQLAEGDRFAVSFNDLLHHGGADVHKSDTAARYEALEKFYKESLQAEPSFRLTPQREARDQSQVASAVEWARAFPGSAGAVAKAFAASYPLNVADDKRAWVAKTDALAMPIMKATEQRLVYGVVLRPNRMDAQDDHMTPVEVEKAAHYYMEHAQVIKLRHGRDPVQKDAPLKAVVMESYIAPVDFKMGRGDVKKGDWVMGVRVDDQAIWDKIQSGEYRGFSVGGVGTRQEIK